MDVYVRVPSKRGYPVTLAWECVSSMYWEGKPDKPRGVWVLCFGDSKAPRAGVEVECTIEQLTELRRLLNLAYDEGKFEQHLGKEKGVKI